MKIKKAELPLIEPLYSTYHHQGACTATLISNPSIKNWTLNESVDLICNRRFLQGYSSPQLTIDKSKYEVNPYLEKHFFDLRTDGYQFNALVRKCIDNGYYVCFDKIDDYYIKGKTWYKQRHFYHDGIICGYDQEKKQYCIYAYDSNWVYRKFWTSQKSFNDGLRSMKKNKIDGYINATKPSYEIVSLVPELIINNLRRYLDSTFENYPLEQEGEVRGIIVHNYISIYLDKLKDGSISYERMDWRVFRTIWEHKKVMLERIKRLEEALGLNSELSNDYKTLVVKVNTMRMLYASYYLKRRDTLLQNMSDDLIKVKKKEKEILEKLIQKAEGVIKDETLELHKK